MAQLVNQILHDRYRIQSLLSRQAGRRTFLATDLETQASVVIKLLLFGPDFTWEDLKLFEREAETLKALDHTAIPRYLDSFELHTSIGKGFALVQSYIEAQTLQSWIQAGRSFSEHEIKTIATQLLEVLNYLHSRLPPVIHRDIKPSNILVGDRSGYSPGNLYLVDFGSVQTAIHGGTVTVVGTYGYMPPEQFGGRSLPASDLYSVGATLIYLLTKTHPADLPMRNGRVQFETECVVSKPFQAWLKHVTQPDPSQRFKDAQLALQALNDEDFTLQPLQLIGAKPAGSRVRLVKTEERLNIDIPPLRIEQKLQVLYTSFFLTVSCCFLLLPVLWKPAIGWFIAPVFIWLIGSIWFHAIYEMFQAISLSIDSKEVCLTSDWFKIRRSRSSPVSNLSKLERLYLKLSSEDTFTRPEHVPRPVVQPSALNLWAGVQCYSLQKVDTNTGTRRLSEVELDWLAAELSDWLDLPIQTFDNGVPISNQNSVKPASESAKNVSEEASVDRALSNAGISNKGLQKFSRPINAVCTVTKSDQVFEISAPAGGDSGAECLGCLIYLIGGFVALSGTFTSSILLTLLGAIPIILWLINTTRISKKLETARVILRVDQRHMFLWTRYQKAFPDEETVPQGARKVRRSDIQKLRLVCWHNQQTTHKYHVEIAATVLGNPSKGSFSKESFLVGNRSHWLSKQEAEWLASELSLWLKLPVTEVEVVEPPSA